MESILIFCSMVFAFSLSSSIILVVYLYKRKVKIRNELGGFEKDPMDVLPNPGEYRKWTMYTGLYAVLCCVFFAIILYQSANGMEDRVLDFVFVLMGAILYTGLAIRSRKKITRREQATKRTSATYVGRAYTTSRNRVSLYSFEAEGTSHEVRVRDFLGLTKGAQVDLYYIPNYPHLFYIPMVEDAKKAWPACIPDVFLYTMSILFPVSAFLAPWFR